MASIASVTLAAQTVTRSMPMKTFFIALAKSAVIGGLSLVAYRNVAGGKWAAGYWWSKRDRELGPGC
jgi:hypothetical protein